MSRPTKDDAALAPRTIGRSLPPDLEKVAVRRFGSLCLIIGIAMVFTTIVRTVAFESGARISAELVSTANVVSGVFAVFSFALYALSRRGASPRTVLRLGLVFELALCLTLASLEVSLVDLTHPTLRLSFVAIVMILFPLVVPAPLTTRVLTTIVSAAMLPLAFFTTIAAQQITVPAPDAMLFLGPTFVSAGFAIAITPIVHGLTRDAAKARQLGAYELVERLGQGGMGEVWRARHRLLARPAAVKLIRADVLGGDAEAARARFEREARATSALGSPNTVELYDFGVSDDGTFFYVMELLQGFDLETLVRDHGPMPPSRVVHVLVQVCRSLADAHGRGLVHRDIKPANVFLCRKGAELDWVKVLDFGLVKAVESAGGDPMLSQENAITGTPAFISPEAALTGKVDARSDLYSLGCVGYFLLTGELVFAGASPMDVVVKHVKDPPPPPSTRTDHPIPAALEEIILACLAKNPDERPASATALRELLAAVDVRPWSEDDAQRFWETHAEALLEPDRPSL